MMMCGVVGDPCTREPSQRMHPALSIILDLPLHLQDIFYNRANVDHCVAASQDTVATKPSCELENGPEHSGTNSLEGVRCALKRP